jgi:hypothetical protein
MVDRATRGTWMSYAALPEEILGDEIKKNERREGSRFSDSYILYIGLKWSEANALPSQLQQGIFYGK